MKNGVAPVQSCYHILGMPQKMRLILTLCFSLFIFKGSTMPIAAATAHEFSFRSIDGGDLPLVNFKGKVILLVNTASMCGFTSQYKGLQELWVDYKNHGLIVLGVPSDDFGGQELDTAKDVKSFCKLNYGIDFPMTDIVVVKGLNAHPYYKWVADKHGSLALPRWNFHKHLIDGNGKLVDWFASTTSPNSKRVRDAIETALGIMP